MAKLDNTENRDTKITLPYRCVSEATQHYAETRDPPSQAPRDHFFSVQRLHGFRQVVQHVRLHVADRQPGSPRSHRFFFSVQRLHGFRQVVQHVQLHDAN